VNKKTLVLVEEDYKKIIQAMREGFIYKVDAKINKTDKKNKIDKKGDDKISKAFLPNNRVATILNLEANLGLRIGDIVKLRLNSFVRDGNRYRLDIVEEKTGKKREFTVPMEIYSYIQDYAYSNNIKPTAKLFEISGRAVQKQLKIVCDYLEIVGVGTHSFRKFFATNLYIDNNYNIELVRKILQHSSSRITQNYIGIQQRDIEEALQNNIRLV